MKVLFLPQGVVWLLDCLYLGEDTTEALEAYQQDREGAQEWLDRECAFHNNPAEEATLETLRFLWQQIDNELESGEPNLEKLSNLFFEASPEMEKIDKARSRGTYSPQPAINRVLQVGAAYLSSGANTECLAEYVHLAEDYRQFLTGMYSTWQEDLPVDMAPPVEEGFAHMKQAVDELKEALDNEDHGACEQALALLKAGSELVQFLLDRVEAQDKLTEEENQSFKIPLIGAELEAQLKAIRATDRSHWQDAVDITLDELVPSLREHWTRSSATLLVPEPEKEQLTLDVDEAIDQVSYVFENAMESEYSAEDVAESLSEALSDLSDCFVALTPAGLKIEEHRDPTTSLYFQACQGLMAMEVPMLTLENLLRKHPPKAGLDCFQAYLEDRADPHLVEGLRLMLEV